MPKPHQSPPPADPVELGREVIRACLGLGFAAAGIAPAAPSSQQAELQQWLALGKHGTMAWMEEYLSERLDVTRLLPGARAVIMVADSYSAAGDDDLQSSSRSDHSQEHPAQGSVARYARGEDYHAVLKRRLKRLADRLRGLPFAAGEGWSAEFRSFVDTGPAMEREHASRAGLGWVGKHTLLIDPGRGSWFVLGGIATTLHILPEPSLTPVSDHCGTCTRCIDACPTQAITPYSVDARRCVSYLTIEHDGPIDPSLHSGVGDRLIGCDVCQEVCPFNSADAHALPRHQGGMTSTVNEAYSSGRGVGSSLPLLEVLGWSEADRSRVMTLSAAKRLSLTMLKRNAIIAAGNALRGNITGTQRSALRARITQLAEDPAEDEVIRETAAQIASRFA